MLGLFLFCKQRFNQNFPRKQTRREKYLFMWGTDLGSLGDLVAEDLALYVAEVCVQRYRLQNQKEWKKKKKSEFMNWRCSMKLHKEKNLPLYCVSCFFSCLICFFSTYFWSVWDFDLYKFGRFFLYKKPSRMLGYVGCTLFSASKRCS